MKILRFIIAHIIPIAAAVIVAILGYQHFVDPRRSEEIGRLKGELATAKVETALAHAATTAASDSLNWALSHQDTAITRWRTRTIHDTTVILRTAHDTIIQVARELQATRAAGDSVVKACSLLADSCRLYREKATVEIASWAHRYAVLDSLYKAPRPGKRWNLSLSVGYGFGMRGDTLVRSPVVGITVGRSLIQW